MHALYRKHPNTRGKDLCLMMESTAHLSDRKD